MNDTAERFFEALKRAIEADELVLPTLPEIALKIRETVEDEESGVAEVADVIMQDASLSARLMQAANSPMYRGNAAVDDLQTAIMRMGTRVVRDLVIRLAMKQMFQATSDALETHFRQTWNTAVEVAAISRMMATTISGVNAEQALLSGLIHNIGALPVLVLAESDEALFNDEEALGELIYHLQSRVGEMIMSHWGFSSEMKEVVMHAHDFSYRHEGAARLVDVVQVSLLQGGFVAQPFMPESLSQVPAFEKLSMDAEINVIEMEDNQALIDDTRASLQI